MEHKKISFTFIFICDICLNVVSGLLILLVLIIGLNIVKSDLLVFPFTLTCYTRLVNILSVFVVVVVVVGCCCCCYMAYSCLNSLTIQ